jgi:signal transduction histidine kinase
VDARALARWGLSEARLPVGTTVEFRTATTWQRHRTVILVAIVLIAAQALLIGQLLLNRRQRIRAQAAVEHQLSYVAHIARVATVGELAATLAHELRQPLAAILLNAQAGAQMLAKDPPELDEVREILDDISADDARAADVIDRIGALLRREQPRFEQVDLNEVCRGVRRLLQSAAAIRRATIDLALDPELPTIMGDPVQLQQVVLNLALNGLDATASCEGDRTVTLGTGMNGVVAELTVGDSGRGLSAESGHRLFEPFYSTKSQGLGMGLAIVRSIVERHGGRVHARNQTSGGAVFRVLLPLESRYRGPMAPTVEGAVITPQRFEPERAPALAAARSPASS